MGVAEERRSPVAFRRRDEEEVEVPVLRIELLGQFRVSIGTREIDESEWYLRKAKSLIKLLVLADCHRLHRGEIMDLLWPDFEPRAAGNNLHKALHVARRVLEPSLPPKAPSRYLHLSGDLVTLNVADAWVDVVEFRAAAERVQATQDIAALQRALALYTGDLLPEDRYEEWTIRPREELSDLHLTLLLELAELHSQRGETLEAIDVLRHVIGVDQANEQAHVGLIHLLAGSGQRQAALRQYTLLREALLQELGAEPDASVQKLYSDILSGNYVAHQAMTSDSDGVVEVDSSARLVGRSSVLEQMRAHVDALCEGHGSMILLHSDAGMGKSSLAAQIEQEAVQRGAVSLWGAGYREEEHIPFGALGMMLEGFAVRIGAGTLRTLADGYAAELSYLAPAFSRVLGQSEWVRPASDRLDEDRMVTALLQFLSALSNHVPLVITLEDLHWADRSTLHFLERVTHLIPEIQILFLCTFRSEDISVRSDLGRLFRLADSDREVESIEVQPLTRAEIGTLAAKLLGAPVVDEVLDLISDIAEGSPYYAEEAVWGLRGRRRIERVNGVWMIRKGIRVTWDRNDVRKLVDAAGDFQLVRKLRSV